MLRRTLGFVLWLVACACSDATPDPGVALATVAVYTAADLPACDTALQGEVRYVASHERLYACTDGKWRAVSTNGRRGPRGRVGRRGFRGPRGPQGAQGPEGVQGAEGQPGLSSLIRSVPLDQSSTECPGVGGVRIETGIDHNANNQLDPDELQSPSAAVCHGEADGGGDSAPGHNALIVTSAEPRGENCRLGGVRIDSGTDANDDGMLDTSESSVDILQRPSFVCNVSGVATSTEPPGENCQYGGQRIEVGADLNDDGELSDFEVTSSLYFCDSLKFTAIDAGNSHTCALVSDGSVRCWGNNDYGQLGRGSPGQSNIPISVFDLDDAVAISVGSHHNCAVTRGGYAVCWGLNSSGQLGSGGTGDGVDYIPTSVRVAGENHALNEVIAISAGAAHSCVVLQGGRVRCWGSNEHGQLGDGTTTNSGEAVPVIAVEGGGELTGATAVAAGDRHTCAVVDYGVQCWGYNGEGQLGTGDTISSTRPRRVVEDGSGYLTEVYEISASWHQTCADAHGRARCWGNNELGVLGDGTTNSTSVPTGVRYRHGPLMAGVQSISTGYYASCAAASPRGSSNVFCWGANPHGQLGNGGTDGSLEGTHIGGYHQANQVTIGERHGCALPSSGRPICWGANDHGQLGNGSTDSSLTAVEVSMQ